MDLDFLVAALQRSCVERFTPICYPDAKSKTSSARKPRPFRSNYCYSHAVQELQPCAPCKVLEFR